MHTKIKNIVGSTDISRNFQLSSFTLWNDHMLSGANKIFLSLLLVLQISVLHAEDFQASLKWNNRVELSTHVTGFVDKILVKPGDFVTKGQILLELDSRDFGSAISIAKANVSSTKLALEEAEREHERVKELFESTLYSENELQLAELASVTAKAKYDSAVALLTRAKRAKHNSIIRASHDGIILKVDAEVGQTFIPDSPAVPLITMASSSNMIAQTFVEPKTLSQLSLQQRAKVIVGSKEYTGVIKMIGFEPVKSSDNSVRYLVEAAFDKPEREVLRAGQSAIIRVK